MGWTRKSRSATLRPRRPDLETLESRTLLTASYSHFGARHGHAAIAPLHSHPSPTASAVTNTSGTSGDLIGAAQTRSTYGVNGSGMTVAVIDTGVNYNNPALGGGFGAGNKVVAGYDFADNTGDPLATSSQHGTAVAGLIASSDATHPGVAPGADVAALRVFGAGDQGNFNNVVAALQWVVDNHAKYNITAVNLSMADGNTYAQNWFAQDGGMGQQITDLVSRLDALNIPVIAATGNNFNGQQGVGFPSIVPDTISVTSTTASGATLSSNAQRLGAAMGGASATDIAAPGEGLIAPVQGNQFGTVDGTSFAAAEVSGAVVLLQQIYESRFGQLPTVDQIDSWLQSGSDPVSDPVTDLAIGRLDIPKAASFIPNPQAQVLAPPVVKLTGQASPDTITASSSSPSSSIPVATAPDPSSTGGTSTATAQDAGGSNGAGAPAAASGSQNTVASLLAGAYKSLSDWSGGWGSPRIWNNVGTVATNLGATQPSGQIKVAIHVTHPGPGPSGPAAIRAHSAFVRSARHR